MSFFVVPIISGRDPRFKDPNIEYYYPQNKTKLDEIKPDKFEQTVKLKYTKREVKITPENEKIAASIMKRQSLKSLCKLARRLDLLRR